MFSENLKKARKEAGFSQGDAAKELGLNPSTYGNYEHTNREPSYSTLKAITKLFGVTADSLIK